MQLQYVLFSATDIPLTRTGSKFIAMAKAANNCCLKLCLKFPTRSHCKNSNHHKQRGGRDHFTINFINRENFIVTFSTGPTLPECFCRTLELTVIHVRNVNVVPCAQSSSCFIGGNITSEFCLLVDPMTLFLSSRRIDVNCFLSAT